VYTRTENTFPKIIGTVSPWQLNKRRQITAYNLGIVVRATSFIFRIWRSVGEGLSSVVTCFATNLSKSRYAIIRFLEKTNNAEKFYSFMNWICDVTFNAERGGGKRIFMCDNI
jgi:hypothetical protein